MREVPPFWVPQSSLPSPEVLLTFVIIDILFLFLSSFFIGLTLFRVFNDRTANQINNPSFIKLRFSSVILSLSIVLIHLDVFISHISGFFTYSWDTQAYLFVGDDSIPGILGVICLIIGIPNLFRFYFNFLSTEGKVQMSRMNISGIISILSVILLIPLNFLNLRITTYSIVLGLLFLLMSASFGIFSYIMLKQTKFTDEVLTIRIYLLLLIVGIWLFFIIISLIFIPREGSLLTRQPSVEFYMVFENILALMTAFLLFASINLPPLIRKIFGIDQDMYASNPNYLLDLPKLREWTIEISNSEEVLMEDVSSDGFFIFTHTNQESDLKEVLKNELPHKGSFGIEAYNDQFFIDQHRSFSNIILITDKHTPHIQLTMDFVNEKYSKDIFVDNYGKLIVNNFDYSAFDGYYAIVVIIPSVWNPQFKLWVIMFDPLISREIERFFDDYTSYLRRVSNQRDIFAVLKFYDPGTKKKSIIPPDSDNPSQPDKDYIAFL